MSESTCNLPARDAPFSTPKPHQLITVKRMKRCGLFWDIIGTIHIDPNFDLHRHYKNQYIQMNKDITTVKDINYLLLNWMSYLIKSGKIQLEGPVNFIDGNVTWYVVSIIRTATSTGFAVVEFSPAGPKCLYFTTNYIDQAPGNSFLPDQHKNTIIKAFNDYFTNNDINFPAFQLEYEKWNQKHENGTLEAHHCRFFRELVDDYDARKQLFGMRCNDDPKNENFGV